MALFDVLMPVKNGAAYLARAIASIQGQTVADWRLLVLDHGSTDRTAAIVQEAAQSDPRIVHHHLPGANGLAGLLNEGLSLVRAPYAMRMDADDEALADRMALTRQAFEAHPALTVLGGQADVIDGDGAPRGELRVPCGADAVARAMLFRNAVLHPTVCFRSQAVADQEIRYGQSRHRQADSRADILMPSLAEDYLLFGEVALDGAALNLPDKLLRYRVHAAGVSRSRGNEQRLASLLISRHLAALLSRRAGRAPFDPAPFCSHGQSMTDVGDTRDYRDGYAAMCEVLRADGGAWARGEGDLSWRAVYADRSAVGIAWRAVSRLGECRPDAWERSTVFNTLQQTLRGKPRLAVAALC